MYSEDYTTRRRIMLLGTLAVSFGLLSGFVNLDWWPFLTFFVEGLILFFVVRELVVARQKRLRREDQLQQIDVNFYKRPVSKDDEPRLSKDITVGVGTQIVYLMVTTKTSVLLRNPEVVFDGVSGNKPVNEGKDYGEMFKKLPNGQIKDWWGNITDPIENPRILSPEQNWPVGIRVKTTGVWDGTLYVQIPVDGETIIKRYLDFRVRPNEKVTLFQNLVISETPQNTVFSSEQSASSTRITRGTL